MLSPQVPLITRKLRVQVASTYACQLVRRKIFLLRSLAAGQPAKGFRVSKSVFAGAVADFGHQR